MPVADEAANHLQLVVLKESPGQTPLFCFPGAGGEVAIFRDMTASMEGDPPVYGVDMRQFFDLDRKFTVEQLALSCLSIIRDKQARGPYHLCGYSFGAIVAYEVASLLSGDGEEIGALGMIDTGCPAFRAQLSSTGASQLQKSYLANRLARYSRLLAEGDFRRFAGSVFAQFAARADLRTRRWIRRAFLAVGQPMPEVFRNNDRTLFEAWLSYKPPAGALSLLLYYWRQRRAEFGGDRTLGWSLCTSGNVDVELASEGHVEMMKLPNVRGFATKLSEILARNAK